MDQPKYIFLVVDDNPNLPITINLLCNKCGLDAEIVHFFNPMEVQSYLDFNRCDLMFLDLEMPEMSGFELLNKIQNPPFTVIMTDFTEKYADKAFKYLGKNLLDFISKDHLIPYFDRVKERFLNKDNSNLILVNQNSLSMNLVKIPISDIKYFFREKTLIYIVVGNKPEKEYYIIENINMLTSKLPKNSFFEARQGLFVMISHVESYSFGKINLGIGYDNKPIEIKMLYRKHGSFVKLIKQKQLF